jgi:hypothetical protein
MEKSVEPAGVDNKSFKFLKLLMEKWSTQLQQLQLETNKGLM